MSIEFRAGLRVRLKDNPNRAGVLSGEKTERRGTVRWEVHFDDGSEFYPELALEPVISTGSSPYEDIRALRFGKPQDIRSALTYFRLSGRLADLIYSLNTTNTDFYAYQFKPVLSFLDSPARGLLIADEVGLGKTIEAGLVWTELRSREEARRLLVLCPAMLREKWRRELADRFGIDAMICSAGDVLARLQDAASGNRNSFALIASQQGLRPPSGWREDEGGGRSHGARLARFLDAQADEEALLDLVIIDEAHYLRNPETQTAKLGKLLRPVSENMLLLSATPIQLGSADLFHLLNLLDRDTFPYEWSFDTALKNNEPLVALRDQLLAGPVTPEDFARALETARVGRGLGHSEVLDDLAENLPSADDLVDVADRLRLADRLDRINPITKVVCRTRKRDVHERRVVRSPVAQRAQMTHVEAMFYADVTEHVRKYCESLEIGKGFLLTIPQRLMCSSMAAACRDWRQRVSEEDIEMEEIVWEAFGSEASTSGRVKITPLITELAMVARSVGDFEELRRHDSKFNLLRDQLLAYWKRFPDAKVILFAYFRETLKYLKERLEETGVPCAVLMGGMDKDQVLQDFAQPGGARILLSSEVASEGVDLQFSSLVVNYDLPWNPMKIEQRIGRIDRIGQKADRILIWNMFLGDTLDDRVYTRLFDRLKIFEQALGATEGILGEQINAMSYELLRHHLSPEEEEEVIQQTAVAMEQNNRLQTQLEDDAARLYAHGDYLQMKISAARQLNRYVTNEDLLAYVRDFFRQNYDGAQFVERNAPDTAQRPGRELGIWCEVDLGAVARAEFSTFLERERLQGKTRLAMAGGGRILCVFENLLQRPRHDVEVISQYHPLVAFVSRKLKSNEQNRRPRLAAIRIDRDMVGDILPGNYVFAVKRWSMMGERDLERLAYEAILIDGTGSSIAPDDAERLVTTSAMRGKDWINARGELPADEISDGFDSVVERLENRYVEYVRGAERENRDRIRFQIETLEKHEKSGAADLQARINILRLSGRLRIIPALEGKIRKLRERTAQKKAELQSRSELRHEQRLACGGVIRVE
ncbi:DEAD/DEAH box helicase [Betaproteobacteria bacterium SCN2]|jgi:superfamily II DNA or RNA helicase|nr:DEAD/DEAH box helicase [Betaproteobacteria bacterium SCN2]